MKILTTNQNEKIAVVALALITLTSLNSCGTIAGAITGGKRPCFLVNAPKDVEVKLDGETLDISSELFASTSFGNVTSDYYAAAVKMPYKKPVTIYISSPSLGKSASLDLKPKGSGAIFWGNVFLAAGVGHIIDAVTHNNKMLQPKYIDVASALNNIPVKDWSSQGKLKRSSKKAAKKNTTKTYTF